MTKTALAAIASFSLLACSRSDDAPTPPGGGNPPVTAAPRLARFFALDTTANPVDTISKGAISYDALGRTQQIQYTDFNGVGDTIYHSVTKYEYSGTDTLVSRKLRMRKSYGVNGSVTSDTAHFGYANGRRNYDSTRYSYVNSRGYTVRRRTFDGNVIREAINYSQTYNGTTSSGTSTRNIHATRQNGNLVQQRDTTRSQTAPNTVHYSRFEFNMGYSSVLNPFYDVVKAGNDEVVGDDLSNFSDFSAPRYLYTSANAFSGNWDNNQTPSNGSITSLQFGHTVRADGYPVIVREKMQNGNGSVLAVIHLIYQ